MSTKRKSQKRGKAKHKPRSSDGFLAIGATVCLFGMVCVGAQEITTPDTRTGQRLVKQQAPATQPVKLWKEAASPVQPQIAPSIPTDPGNWAEFLQEAKRMEDEALAEICQVKQCERKGDSLYVVAQADVKPGKDLPYGARR